jgi:hypothetical protein
MTISKDLFLSVLAMDSYNRGYNAGIADFEGVTDGEGINADGLGETGRIGASTLVTRVDLSISDIKYLEWQDAGFYAIAYDIGAGGPEGMAGQTVISYRGTDTSLDHSTGWIVGAGNIDDWTQAPLALDFYNAVTGTSYRDGPAGNVILTGHSLGDGLIDHGPALFGFKMARAA